MNVFFFFACFFKEIKANISLQMVSLYYEKDARILSREISLNFVIPDAYGLALTGEN